MSEYPSDWHLVKLGDTSTISASSVDKKIKVGQKSVRLCNYMDVFRNSAITESLSFMESTASNKEIREFSLCKGDVLLTKDSEVPEEIGIPSIVRDDIADLLSGYHLYILRSDESQVEPEYLCWFLRGTSARKHFYKMANGSTRFGLNVKYVAECPVLLPPLPEQKKIAEILSGIDHLIKTHSAKKSKMSDLLVAMRARIFTNASGKEVSLGELCSPKQWPTISADQITETGYPVYGANGQIGFYSEYNHQDPVLAVTCRGATCGNLNLIPGFSYVTGNSMCLDNLSEDISIQYLYHFLVWRELNDVISGSAQPQITRTPLQAVQIVVPAKQRQSEVVSMLAAIATLHDHEKEMIARLENLKNAVSIDLLSGRKRVMIQP